MPPQMHPLKPTDPDYRKHVDYFNHNWRHALKGAVVRKVFCVRNKELAASYRWRRHKRYGGKSVHRARLLFHGTSRACNAGEEKRGGKMKWCNKSNCGLCGILRNSFKISKSKSDVFVINMHQKSRLRAMFLCQVISERPQKMILAGKQRTAPDPGYDSVEGLVVAEGGILSEPETVVYRDDAIVPVAVIMYETFASRGTGNLGVRSGTPLAAVGGVLWSLLLAKFYPSMNLIRSPRNKRHKKTIRLNNNLLIQLPLLRQRPRTARTRTTTKILPRPHNPLRPHSNTSLGISSTANTIRYTQTRHGPAPIPRQTRRQHESLAGRKRPHAAIRRAKEWVSADELHVGRRLFEAHNDIVIG
ncbi:hypothetical protein FACUT_4180 [Fusarium acutatum]|uniref:Uncharacterized protein n=1 Tax=Fusarium acutatum TaxID=78861 RepID=A0A8H4NLB8_9HYPO|nr:hypothetical protein FACUT_4180 [Fusarium acutatum]